MSTKAKVTFKFAADGSTHVKEVDLDELAARHVRLLRGIAPYVERDAKRQAGTTKPRCARRPKLDKWLDEQLARDPGAQDKVLWKAVKTAFTYNEDGDVIRVDGRDLTFAGFGKRVTTARKRKSAANY